MSKYCAQLKATEFDHQVEAYSEFHDWTFCISDNDDIEIVDEVNLEMFGEWYLIRPKDSNGNPLFVRKQNIQWFCGGCCEWYASDPDVDICDEDCELNFDGSVKP